MAEVIYYDDGSIDIISCNRAQSWERVINKCVGDDAARYFADYIADLEEDIKLCQDAADENERIADGYLAMCQDAAESLEQILKFFQAARLNRSALEKAVRNAYNALWRNL